MFCYGERVLGYWKKTQGGKVQGIKCSPAKQARVSGLRSRTTCSRGNSSEFSTIQAISST